MSVIATFTKQPIDRLDYDFDYSKFLANTDVVETAEFIVEPEGLYIDAEIVEPTFTKVWVHGGVAGTVYKISCTVTTAHGRVKQDEIKVRVREY